MTVKILEEKFWKEQHDIHSRTIYRHVETGKVFKTEIDVNSYDFQSYARAEVLVNDKWQYLYNTPYPEMESIKLKINIFSDVPTMKATISFDQGILYAMALKLLNIIS
jgi:hypothetical protein